MTHDNPQQHLYSPLTGQAFAQGTPEYEAGFGPMGEELVMQPPEGSVHTTSPTPPDPTSEHTQDKLAHDHDHTYADTKQDNSALSADDFSKTSDDPNYTFQPLDEPISMGGSKEPTSADDELAYGIHPVDAPVVFEQPADLVQAAPTPNATVLYSSLSGQAFHPGSPEYEDGYGPMGEELLSSPPADVQPTEFDKATDPEPAAVHQEPAPPKQQGPVGPNTQKPLPTPGRHVHPATLTLYVQKQPVHTHSIDTDETLLGRRDVQSDVEPDLDLTTWDTEGFISRKHAYVYRQNKNYTLYAVSNGGVQVNTTLLDLGDRHQLCDGDVIVLAGQLAFKFALPTG